MTRPKRRGFFCMAGQVKFVMAPTKMKLQKWGHRELDSFVSPVKRLAPFVSGSSWLYDVLIWCYILLYDVIWWLMALYDVIWWSYDGYMMVIWWLYDGDLMVIWRYMMLYDGHMMVIWWLYDVKVVNLMPKTYHLEMVHTIEMVMTGGWFMIGFTVHAVWDFLIRGTNPQHAAQCKNTANFMDIYGYLWIFMSIYGYLWVFMDIYGLWIDVSFFFAYLAFLHTLKGEMNWVLWFDTTWILNSQFWLMGKFTGTSYIYIYIHIYIYIYIYIYYTHIYI